MSAPFDVRSLALEAKLSAQEFERFVEQCGSTRDDRYKRDQQQMDRLRERMTSKWALADFMERAAGHREGGGA